MTSEIRANTLKNRVGLGTVSFTNTGPVVSGIVTANTLRLPDATSGSLGRVQLGNGLHLSLYHNGSNSFLVNNTGYLSIQSQDGVNGIFIARNAEVNLYFGSSVRLQTSSVGVTINRDLDVDGHTNLDNVSIAGVSTFNGDINIDDGAADSAAGPELKLNRGSASPANADYLGQIKFAGRSSTGAERNYAKITGKILDVTNGSEDGILEFAHIKAGSQVITGRWRSDSLQLLNSTNFSVAGTSEFTGTATFSEALTLSKDTTDVINFSANSTSDKRGISFNGRTALSADYNDGFLRLNNENGFTNGVYTPSIMRADGGFRVDSHVVVNSSGFIVASRIAGALPAIDGSNLTGITQTTINNNADNRVITGSGTANTLEAESGLTYNGTTLQLAAADDIRIAGGTWTGEYTGGIKIQPDASNS